MHSLRYLMSLVFFVGTLSIGCAALTGKTAGRNIDDATISATVKTNLAAERAVTLTKIDVDTNEGVVHLSGVVDSVEMKQRAAEVARQVSGVKRVVNNLQVAQAQTP
jgi:hyperosmotically inducible periplasmic protein